MLYFGDNLDILKNYVKDNSVDLIYLDPPFNSNKNYNQIFTIQGKKSVAQINAFEDTWSWNPDVEKLFRETVQFSQNNQVSSLLLGMRELLGISNMMSYLTMMAPRLIELRRVLKDTGSIYLHCDPTASHYLKILMDAVFGLKNFRNEIVWCYAGGGIPKKDFPRKHDIILRYTKTNEYIYMPVFRPYTEGTKQRGRTKVKGIYAEKGLRPEGTPINDWWTDIPKITSPTDPEKLGYPTQKPVTLLERIIKVSSEEGQIILDPFCGCGTTIEAAERLNRSWIGIDITHIAIQIIKDRLNHRIGNSLKPYEVAGEPFDLDGAKELASNNRYQFQLWALHLLGITSGNNGPDGGIDGIYFFEDESSKLKKCIAQVKSGKVSVKDIRELHGVVKRDRAEIGILITLNTPTKAMIQEAASYGVYESSKGIKCSIIQIVEVSELINHKKFLHNLIPL